MFFLVVISHNWSVGKPPTPLVTVGKQTEMLTVFQWQLSVWKLCPYIFLIHFGHRRTTIVFSVTSTPGTSFFHFWSLNPIKWTWASDLLMFVYGAELILDCHWLSCVQGEGLTDRFDRLQVILITARLHIAILDFFPRIPTLLFKILLFFHHRMKKTCKFISQFWDSQNYLNCKEKKLYKFRIARKKVNIAWQK